MKKLITLVIFILLFLHVSIGQTEYEVVKDIYLKANPDSYADNLMLIPAGKIVKKDISSEYPFIRITFNGEVGYVSLNDLKTRFCFLVLFQRFQLQSHCQQHCD